MVNLHDDNTLVKAMVASEVEGVRWLARHHSFGDTNAGDPFALLPANVGDPVAWIAEADNRITGFVFGWESFGKVAHICQVRVHAQYEGHDIDRRLVKVALESAREHGCLKVILHNMSDTTWAVDVVTECGFTFNRQRNSPGDHCLEFYLDIYARPGARQRSNYARGSLGYENVLNR